MQFSDIPGIKKDKQYLIDLMASNRLPHAMIFTGPEGNAKLALAISFANYLQCKDRGEDVCGKCNACAKTSKNVHPDIHFVFPVVKKDSKKREDTVSTDFYPQWRSFIDQNIYGSLTDWLRNVGAVDKQSNINTKECNEISHKIGLKSYEGQYKILIVWQAESLGKDGNRLLKLIEEPPEDTIIILIAERVDKVIKTVTSRCQIFNIPPFKDEEIIQGLQSRNIHAKPELIYMADGNMQLALSLVSGNLNNYSEDILDWMRIAYQMKPSLVVSWVNDFIKKGKQEQINFLSYGLYYMKEYRKALVSGNVEIAKLSEKEKDVAVKMSKIIDEEKSRAIVELLEIKMNHLKRNANARILFMDMTVSLEAIMKGLQLTV